MNGNFEMEWSHLMPDLIMRQYVRALLGIEDDDGEPVPPVPVDDQDEDDEFANLVRDVEFEEEMAETDCLAT